MLFFSVWGGHPETYKRPHLDLDTWWRWVVSFTPCLLYHWATPVPPALRYDFQSRSDRRSQSSWTSGRTQF